MKKTILKNENVEKYVKDKLLDKFNELTENFDAEIANIYTTGFFDGVEYVVKILKGEINDKDN